MKKMDALETGNKMTEVIAEDLSVWTTAFEVPEKDLAGERTGAEE